MYVMWTCRRDSENGLPTESDLQLGLTGIPSPKNSQGSQASQAHQSDETGGCVGKSGRSWSQSMSDTSKRGLLCISRVRNLRMSEPEYYVLLKSG
jgi:hypothetical protein